MITTINTEFIERSKVEFIQDDDQELNWLSSFNSDKYDRILIFIDQKVDNIWGEKIISNLKKHNKDLPTLKINSIEESKSMAFYPKAIKFLETNKCSRFDLVLAIGGGIVLDLVSFTVSTYMRGIPLIMIPTTLIGQTDASTAGKTCLNSHHSKNLLGTFYYPKIVYNNINFLNTNSNRFLRQGFSESFKYGLLNSKELIEYIISYHKSNDKNILQNIISQTIQSRIEIRHKDALASNLGHTFGHAMEKYSDYQILHGDAISAGTVMALHYAVHIGIMSEEIKNEIIEIMKTLGLNLYIDKQLTANELVQLMLLDKKSSSKILNLVLITDITIPYREDGRLFCKSMPFDVISFLEIFLKNYKYRIDNCAEFLEQDNIYYKE